MTSANQISVVGFSTHVKIAELCSRGYSGLPNDPGIYFIERESDEVPTFVPSTAGRFKGKDPNYPLDIVRENWVDGAHIVYIGKAAGRKGLRQRVAQLIDFGCGKPVGHRGGRMLWHLKDSRDLLVRWRVCSAGDAERFETIAVAEFKGSHRGMRPFANMNK